MPHPVVEPLHVLRGQILSYSDPTSLRDDGIDDAGVRQYLNPKLYGSLQDICDARKGLFSGGFGAAASSMNARGKLQ